MSEPLEDIDKFFLDNIEPLQEEPAANVWQNISASLDKDSAERYRRKAVFFKRLSAALLLLLLGTGAYEILNKNKKTTNPPAANLTDTSAINKNINSGEAAINKNSVQLADTITKPAVPAEISSANNSAASTRLSSVNNNKNHIKSNVNKITVVIPGPANNFNKADSKTLQDSNPLLNATIKKNDTAIPEPEKTATEKVKANDGLVIGESTPVTVVAQPPAGAPANEKIVGDNNTLADAATLNNVVQAKQKNKKSSLKNSASPFSLTAYFSPQIAGYSLRDDGDHFPGQRDDDDKDKIKQREQHKLAYTAGVMLNYKIANKWLIQTGVNLSKTKIDVKPTTLYANTDNTGKIQYRYNSSSGYAYVLPSFNSSPTVGDSCFTGRSVNSLQYIGIPLNIAYIIKIKKWVIQPAVGIGANFLVHSEIETQLKDGTNVESKSITNVQGLRSVYFNMMASAEVLYPLTKKFSFSFSPVVRLALSSINKGNIVKSFTNSIGSSIGINYKF